MHASFTLNPFNEFAIVCIIYILMNYPAISYCVFHHIPVCLISSGFFGIVWKADCSNLQELSKDSLESLEKKLKKLEDANLELRLAKSGPKIQDDPR